MQITLGRRILRSAILLSGAAVVAATTLAAQQPVPPIGAGEFRAGDRIIVRVDSEPQLSDTFTVVVGPALVFPVIGQVSLAGVTHQTLERHLTREIARYVRSPVVHAHPLLRLGILGEVGRPSYYVVNADATIAEAIQVAGGLTGGAKISEVHIDRNDATIMGTDSVRAALASGISLDRFGVQSGDEIVVPRVPDRGGDLERILRVAGIVFTLPLAIIALKRGL